MHQFKGEISTARTTRFFRWRDVLSMDGKPLGDDVGRHADQGATRCEVTVNLGLWMFSVKKVIKEGDMLSMSKKSSWEYCIEA